MMMVQLLDSLCFIIIIIIIIIVPLFINLYTSLKALLSIAWRNVWLSEHLDVVVKDLHFGDERFVFGVLSLTNKNKNKTVKQIPNILVVYIEYEECDGHQNSEDWYSNDKPQDPWIDSFQLFFYS